MELAKTRCLSHFSQSEELHSDEFRWDYTLPEMADKFESIYESGKRLFMHTNYEPKQKTFLLYVDPEKPRPVPITENFIKSVTLHIETALQKGFADFVFFPDMGHSHLHFPEEHWDSFYRPMDLSYKNRHNIYEKFLADPKMKALYHLGEQLQFHDQNEHLLKDSVISFKYWHRNFVGQNDGTRTHSVAVIQNREWYNTVTSLPDYHRHSQGYAISASHKGCFPYIDKDGKTRFFDIGFFDPRPKRPFILLARRSHKP